VCACNTGFIHKKDKLLKSSCKAAQVVSMKLALRIPYLPAYQNQQSSQFIAISSDISAALQATIEAKAVAGFKQVQVVGFSVGKSVADIGFLFDLKAKLDASVAAKLEAAVKEAVAGKALVALKISLRIPIKASITDPCSLSNCQAHSYCAITALGAQCLCNAGFILEKGVCKHGKTIRVKIALKIPYAEVYANKQSKEFVALAAKLIKELDSHMRSHLIASLAGFKQGQLLSFAKGKDGKQMIANVGVLFAPITPLDASIVTKVKASMGTAVTAKDHAALQKLVSASTPITASLVKGCAIASCHGNAYCVDDFNGPKCVCNSGFISIGKLCTPAKIASIKLTLNTPFASYLSDKKSSLYAPMAATVAGVMETHMKAHAVAGFKQVQVLGFSGKAKTEVNIGFLFDMSATVSAAVLKTLKASIEVAAKAKAFAALRADASVPVIGAVVNPCAVTTCQKNSYCAITVAGPTCMCNSGFITSKKTCVAAKVVSVKLGMALPYLSGYVNRQSSAYIALSAKLSAGLEAHLKGKGFAGFKQVQVLGFNSGKLSAYIGVLFDASATVDAAVVGKVKASLHAAVSGEVFASLGVDMKVKVEGILATHCDLKKPACPGGAKCKQDSVMGMTVCEPKAAGWFTKLVHTGGKVLSKIASFFG